MNDWKKIDYNKLKKDGLILIEEAQQTDNIDKYYEAIDNFVEAHHDGHMSLSFYNDSDYYLNKISEFNDYGLSSIRLEDGSIIAINVEDNLDSIIDHLNEQEKACEEFQKSYRLIKDYY